ncbi:MAG TPA: protein-L-isoaspartate(D-aspartate) O-methyltransferase [Candidatus Omnitrophica bacterium]|nr:MAG: protein-L-isoaspartate O-methyltransferase [Candidatus Omnitrophota bacterium]RKY43369.1 MAG: protein-L-isoaspartate O-methyltransferase [Candidatus Omnitrophota bacterium]HEC69423.1 protein-L-isoaspartate(D-aspartate) O-methyltransferase [Candidatus Omnitrophota bacterium]
MSKIFIFFLYLILISSCSIQDNYTQKRVEMVKAQIITRGIRDKEVIRAMLRVERHRFVPKHLRNFAYEDRPLPIGEGQTISQPYIVALMTELLRLNPQDRILEIGTGSGYQAAILAEIAKEVYTVEILPTLAERAKNLLEDLGYKNIRVKCGDGYLGWPEYAPFEAIIVTCAPEHIPQPLITQLAEGGRMVIPVGKFPYQKLLLVEKKEGKIKKKEIIPVLFVPMLRR